MKNVDMIIAGNVDKPTEAHSITNRVESKSCKSYQLTSVCRKFVVIVKRDVRFIVWFIPHVHIVGH